MVTELSGPFKRNMQLISNLASYCIFELATQGSHVRQMYSVHPDLISLY